MPRKDLNAKQNIVYDILEVLSMEVGDTWETRNAIEEWVNDSFYLTDYKIVGDGDDAEIDEGHLEWQ